MIDEIKEIPEKARKVYKSTQKLKLPTGVPYLGMGSSYYAMLSIYYQGVNIRPEASSTFYNYLSKHVTSKSAVLISQSGKSSETLWCRELFDEYDERVLIGEIYLPVERLVSYYGSDLQGVHLPFNFQLILSKWDARHIDRLIRDMGDLAQAMVKAATQSLLDNDVPTYVVAVDYTAGPPRYRLYAGAYETLQEAETMAGLLDNAGVTGHTLRRRTGRTGE